MMSAWDQDPQVRSPVGQPIARLLEEGPRRQQLDGFEPVYRDFVDYILRCTHRIWEEKNVGLCRTHYSDDCPVHTLMGPTVGAETVTQNTVNAVSSYSDRLVIGEDVIWSEDAPGLFLSSHRIMSRSTHMGDDPIFGPASMRSNGVMTIADCLCRENRIVEESLVRDNLRAAWQLGGEPREIARALAEADREGDQTRHDWRSEAIARVRAADMQMPPGDHPSALPARILALALSDDLYGDAAALLSPAVEIRWPSNRHGFGRGFWIGCMTQIRAALHNAAWSLDHWAARPLPGDDIAVALRWSLAGTHRGVGVWGPPTGRELLVMAVSHYRLRAGAIVEDITVFDELAILRQIEGGLGA
jgi:hypothetical protein